MSGTDSKAPLSAEAFEKLLRALADDRERAGELYETLRRKLVKFFEWRGAAAPDTLTDRTFDRVARKLEEGETIRSSDPATYVYAVARNILKESWVDERKRREAARGDRTGADGSDTTSTERLHECLERCLGRMPERSRALLLRYYSTEGAARIAGRRAEAEELGVPLNALRIRMHRLRTALETCVRDCLAGAAGETNRLIAHVKREGREKP